MPHRTLLLFAGALLALACLPTGSFAGPLSTWSTCDGDRVAVHWSWHETPGYPALDPLWTGYDVYRRSMADCGAWVRVNDVPYPRTMGASESFTHVDAPPPSQPWEYRVMLVTDDRQQAPYPSFEAWDMGSWANTYAGCPEALVPVTRGMLQDGGWTIYLNGCPGSCYPSVYITDDYGAMTDLRPYVGSEVRIFGRIGCGSIEGCFLANLDHFEFAPCSAPTGVRPDSWGQLKVRYR